MQSEQEYLDETIYNKVYEMFFVPIYDFIIF